MELIKIFDCSRVWDKKDIPKKYDVRVSFNNDGYDCVPALAFVTSDGKREFFVFYPAHFVNFSCDIEDDCYYFLEYVKGCFITINEDEINTLIEQKLSENAFAS